MRNLLAILTLATVCGFQARANVLEPLVINGSKLDPSEIQAMSTLQGDGFSCTATLVGPNVIITAAHCVNDQPNQTFTFVDGTATHVHLTVNPEYDPNGQSNIPYDFAMKHDLAIGVLDRTITKIRPISLTRQTPNLKAIVMFAGEGSPTFERMFGFARVVTKSNNGLTVRGFGAKPQIGAPGDSGGPNFIVNKDGSVAIYGVASTSTRESDWSKQMGWPEAKPYTEGVATVLPEIKDGELSFVESFVQKNKLKVCGLNLDCAPVQGPQR